MTQYQHTAVADLAWILMSPSLFVTEIGGYTSFSLPHTRGELETWLQTLDKTPSCPLSDAGVSRTHFSRLGLYAEALLTFYFQHAPGLETGDTMSLIQKNFKVLHEKRTLGEFDFLLQLDQKIVHIELAVKFYLQNTDGTFEWRDWIGPNSIDRLDIKMKRMFEHQLALPYTGEGLKALQPITQHNGTSKELISQYLIKGVLFRPYTHTTETLPRLANPLCETGIWMRLRDFLQWTEEAETSGGVLLNKMDWLSPPKQHTKTKDEIIHAIRELYERARAEKKNLPGTMVRMRTPSQMTPPIMIVHDDWPGCNMPSRRI